MLMQNRALRLLIFDCGLRGEAPSRGSALDDPVRQNNRSVGALHTPAGPHGLGHQPGLGDHSLLWQRQMHVPLQNEGPPGFAREGLVAPPRASRLAWFPQGGL